MEENRILIVDDDIHTTTILNKILSTRGFTPTVCHNGIDALDEFKKRPYPIVITDLEMPEMDGIELVENLKSLNEETVILVLTAMEDSSTIIKTMKFGVYDYIVKPMNIDEVYLKLQNAKELSALKRTERKIQREKRIRLELQIEWYRWQERVLEKKLDITDAFLFEGVRRSFTQGTGFGSLLTLVDLLCSNAVSTENDTSVIDNNIISLLKENIGYAKRGLSAFSEIENIHKNSLNMSPKTVMDLFKKTKSVISSLEDQVCIKNNTFLISEPKKYFKNRNLQVDVDYFEKMIHELLLNSLKYSQKNSAVTVIIDIINENFIMHIMNIPEVADKGVIGIPEEYENIIFEPFFRISKTLHENYRTLDYGIGLTMCDKIADKSGGRIRIFNINDFSDISKGPQIKVCCEVQFPLI
ncbi:MAG TPA: response regulator [Spirochaetota bacterium]|nr:response regulator [Spirochaetota bacterium]HPJ36095.1 response regulator [Spirochaetota bacterium]